VYWDSKKLQEILVESLKGLDQMASLGIESRITRKSGLKRKICELYWLRRWSSDGFL
jgi:hypothetical protein